MTEKGHKKKRKSWLEERVAAYLAMSGLPQPTREFRFAPPRLFRFDFAWPALGIALEIQGGIWTRGAHSRGIGLADDCVKLNLAALDGWRVFKVTEREIRNKSAFSLIHMFLTKDLRYVPRVLTEARTSL